MIQIGIIGSAGKEEYPEGGKPQRKVFQMAEKLGQLVAKQNAILVTGGKGGIMETASKGAKVENGITVGIVKGDKRYTANKYIDIEISSNTNGEGEEDILVSSCDGLIVVGGGAGTLQELACAYRKKKPIVALRTVQGISSQFAGKYLDSRKLVKIHSVLSEDEAIDLLIKLIK